MGELEVTKTPGFVLPLQTVRYLIKNKQLQIFFRYQSTVF